MALRKALLLIAGSAALLGGCDWMKKKEAPAQKTKAELASEQKERIRKACASDATYARLKELVFDEAARIRNSDPRNLDPARRGGRGPDGGTPGQEPRRRAERHRLHRPFHPRASARRRKCIRRQAAARRRGRICRQAAVDGSGLVYQMDGAEPIIYRLATFGLSGQATRLEAGGPGRLPPPPAAAGARRADPHASGRRGRSATRAAAVSTGPNGRAASGAGAPAGGRAPDAGDGASELQLPLREDPDREDGLHLAAARRSGPGDGVALLRPHGQGRSGDSGPFAPKPRLLPRTPRAMPKRELRQLHLRVANGRAEEYRTRGLSVIPAKAGTSARPALTLRPEVPASAGMTGR